MSRNVSDYINHKEYKLPNGRTVTANFNELGMATITIQAMDALFDILNSSDVVEVVRCANCKWFNPINNGDHGYCGTPFHGAEVYEDDYCSDGERRQDGRSNQQTGGY